NHSSDYGASFGPSDAQIDRSPTPIGDADSVLPSIALGGEGQVYIAWSDPRDGARHMRLNRSADFGESWQAADQRVDSASAIQTVWGSIAADNRGHVYGVWFYDNPDAGVFDVRFSSSSDGGATWQPSETIIGSTGVAVHPFAPHIAADQSGRVYVTWLRYSGGGRIRHAYVNASAYAGVGWPASDQGMQS